MNESGSLPSNHQSPWGQVLTGLIAIASAALIIHLQWQKLNAQQKDEVLPKAVYLQEEKDIKTNIELIGKLPTLGFDNLIASWAFLNFIQYFGDDNARNATGYSVTPKFFEVAVNHDPQFLDMYPFLSSTITLFSGRPAKSINLLEKGIQAMDDSRKGEAYFLWQAKATDELLFMGNPSAARESYLNAAEWASLSTDQETQSIGARAKETAQFLAQNPDSRSAQIASWFNVLNSAVDERTQQLAIQQIQELGGVVTFENDKLKVNFPKDTH